MSISDHSKTPPRTNSVNDVEKITFRVIMLCLLASMGGFIFGYDTGEISGLVAMPNFIDRFAEPGGFSNRREGLIVSLLSVGAFCGAATAGLLADRPKIGRRGLIMIACWIFIAGTIIQIASITSWVQLMVGRFVAGVAVGQLSAIVPVYQSETAPKSIRGTLTSTYQLFITFGILLAYLINFGTVKINNGNSPACWRITIGIGFIWAFGLFMGMVFMPESPRFTLKCGNHEKCKTDMMRIRGVDANNQALLNDIAEMQEAMEIDSKLPHGLGELYRGEPKVFYRVALAWTLQMFQQLTGMMTDLTTNIRCQLLLLLRNDNLPVHWTFQQLHHIDHPRRRQLWLHIRRSIRRRGIRSTTITHHWGHWHVCHVHSLCHGRLASR